MMAETTNADQVTEFRNARRVKKLLMSWQFLVEMLKHNDAPFRLQVTKNALPADARCVGMMPVDDRWGPEGCGALIIQSQSWDEVPDGVPMPTLLEIPELTRIYARDLVPPTIAGIPIDVDDSMPPDAFRFESRE